MTETLQRTFAHRAAEGERSGPLLRKLLELHAENQAILAGDQFLDTVAAMTQAAKGLGSDAVFGASPLGHALAGAIAAQQSGLPLWWPSTENRVLLVDGVVAGLAGMAGAAMKARSTGAIEVAGLVIGLRGGSGDEASDALSRVVTLDQALALAA